VLDRRARKRWRSHLARAPHLWFISLL